MGKKREDEMQSILTRLTLLACLGLPVSLYLVYDHWNPQEQCVTRPFPPPPLPPLLFLDDVDL
jgi:hypothetical protein